MILGLVNWSWALSFHTQKVHKRKTYCGPYVIKDVYSEKPYSEKQKTSHKLGENYL